MPLPALVLVPLLLAPLAWPRPQELHRELEGTWRSRATVPGRVELADHWLTLAVAPDGAWSLRVETPDAELELPGRVGDDGTALFEGAGPDGAISIELELRGERLVGAARYGTTHVVVDAAREVRTEPPAVLVVDFARARPRSVARAGLPRPVAELADELLPAEMERQRVVGLSAAFVLDGEVVDVRSYGWQDYHADVPAAATTMYRWASISKPVTAVAALQLAEKGALDLDADVREYVPEWPHPTPVVTARQLLCHQAGIVHYQHMLPRTLREHDVEHPWADPLIALEMFAESPVLFEPGTRYSYSTPGYVLLGAVVDRAGEGSFVEQVLARICRPLGMDTMQPDHQWVDVPHRATGYRQAGERTIATDDDDISWKLAAGGWISTVEDLARFGAGLMGDELLSLESRLAMWEDQRTADGRATGYGLGVGVGSVGELLTVAHSGGQNKTSTYLVCAPEANVAVALMCNTQGTDLRTPSTRLLAALLGEGD